MPDDYAKLVAEAFIDPIRSVLIVDDDYPTLNEILLERSTGQASEEHAKKSWRANPDGVLAVVREFRSAEGRPYILDIHDGEAPPSGTDERQAHRLQQTDLLVLDYELNGAIRDGGRKAIAIAREALTNDHFNLILVHTREPLEVVFDQFLLGLLRPLEPQQADAEHEQVIDDHLDALLEFVTDQAYLEYRRPGRIGDDTPSGPLVQLMTALEAVREGPPREAVLGEAIAEYERRAIREARFADRDVGVRAWRSDGVTWIRCDQGFVAFKQKGDGIPLIQTLKETLASWRPFPSRLLLTKLRAEMNERGIEVQDDALGDRTVGAAWFHEMVAAPESFRGTRVEEVIRNHSEQLLDQLLPRVANYAQKLVGAFPTDANDAVAQAFDGFDLTKQETKIHAVIGRNAFAASKPVGGVHLEFGHILEVAGGFWACMTPACDMVPGRHRNLEYELDDAKGRKRFVALRLHDIDAAKLNKVVKSAQNADHAFVNIAGDDGTTTATVFGLTRPGVAAPATMTMYADDDGLFPEGAKRLTIRYILTECHPDDTSGGVVPTVIEETATVRGHLRYEYALHIQSLMTSGQSRIGLDFSNLK